MIQILMSSYNGEKYIEEQIDSILSQENAGIKLLVRDDGSTDNTINILEKYKRRGLLEYYSGPNIGWKKSFFDLMLNAPDAEYYAFADQDDFWLPNKLSEAMKAIDTLPEGIRLYLSNCLYWRDNEIKGLTRNIKPRVDKYTCHLWILSQGCTYLFNKPLLEIIKKAPPTIEVEHDGWVFRTANLTGHIYFDMNSYIKYRQHNSNQQGAALTIKEKYKNRIHSFRYILRNNDLELRSKELLNCYGKILNEESYKICDTIASYKRDLKKYLTLLFSPKYSCEIFTRTIGFKFRVLIRHI